MAVYDLLNCQRNVWNIQTAYPDTDVCNIGGYLHLEGKYDTVLLQKTMEVFVKSQSSFWTRVNKEGKIYFEEITGYHMDEYNFSDKDEKQIDSIIHNWICEPFDIYNGYLFDFRLLVLKDKVIIFEKFHHMIADGYAVSLCAKFQEKIYEELENGKTEFEKDIRYLQEVKLYKQDCKVKEKIDIENKRIVSLNKGNHNPQADIISGYITDNTDWYEKRFNYKEFNSFLRQYRISAEAMFYGCIGIYFCKLQDCDVMCIGRNLLNRRKEEMNLIALRVNTLPFYVTPDWNMGAAQYLAMLKKELSIQSKNSNMPQMTSANKMNMEISYRPVRYLPSPQKGECREYMNSSVEIPVKIFINDDGKSIQLQVKYQTSTFSNKQIRQFIHRVLYVMEQVLENPDIHIGNILIAEKQDYHIINRFNSTKNIIYKMSLAQMFLLNVKHNFNKTAMIYGDNRYSYKKVYGMIIAAVEFISRNIGKNNDITMPIGLCVRRTPWLPVLMYASWFSGYPFLPVSPDDSVQRKKEISNICSAFITDDMIEELENVKIAEHAEIASSGIRENLPAYYIFTSGTTGEPKTVMISHKSLYLRLMWMNDTFNAGTEIILQKTRNTFDVSIWELIYPFAFGKTICILEDGKESYPDAIAEKIKAHHVTMVHFVPSMFRLFFDYIKTYKIKFEYLKYIILSGEEPEAELVSRAKKYMENVEIYNLYGPAECTIDVTGYRCTGIERRIPLGHPVYNTELYVTNRFGDVLPVGEKGELVISGDLVGLGYFNEKNTGYIEYPEGSGKMSYRTGDMAVMEEDGMLYYKGRTDSQIKLRGMRINLKDVESSLNKHISGTYNIIMFINGRIIDFYTGHIDSGMMKREAAKVIPYYCIPSEFVNIDSVPIGAHGKTDRNQLEKVYLENVNYSLKQQRFSKDKNIRKKEKVMLDIVINLLKRKDITIETNLFELGIDSLTAVSFVSKCKQYGINIKYEDMYNIPYIKYLAQGIESTKECITYLKNSSDKRILLLIPFAGGTPYTYKGVAERLESKNSEAAVAVVDMPQFTDKSTEYITREVKRYINSKKYEEIYIAGFCAGSALAVGLSSALGNKVKGLMLCESLPFTNTSPSGKVIWDYVPDKILQGVLQLLKKKKFETDKQLLYRFRNDVRESAAYLKRMQPVSSDCKVILVFGSCDILTLNYKKKYKKWRKWIPVSYKIYTIKGVGHFMAEECPIELADIIFNSLLKIRRGKICNVR